MAVADAKVAGLIHHTIRSIHRLPYALLNALNDGNSGVANTLRRQSATCKG